MDPAGRQIEILRRYVVLKPEILNSINSNHTYNVIIIDNILLNKSFLTLTAVHFNLYYRESTAIQLAKKDDFECSQLKSLGVRPRSLLGS